jgi:ankyrin repeat protein
MERDTSPDAQKTRRDAEATVAALRTHTAELGSESLLMWACRRGNVEVCEVLLDMGEDPNFVTPEGLTPLFYACAHADVKLTKMLLRAGADGSHALSLSCMNGNVAFVETLLSAGVDPSHPTENWLTPLERACIGGSPWVNEYYTDSWCGPTHGPATAAKIVELLLRAGADKDGVDTRVDPPLVTACDLETADVVEVLLHSGAAVNKVGRYGWTPLARACCRENVAAIVALLRAGANIHASYRYGYLAVDHTHRPEVIEIMSREYRRDMRTVALGISTQSSPLSLLAGFGHITEFIVAMSLPNAILKKVPELL